MSKREQRAHPRRKTRLRSGKVADLTDRFLSECTIFDLSRGGCRLLVPDHVALPEEILIFDDLDKTIALARITWREGKQLGVAFEIPPAPVSLFKAQRLKALQFNYYAVVDDD